MNHNILTESISTINNVDAGITKPQASSHIVEDAFPALYIEALSKIEVNNSIIRLPDMEFSIIGLTILEVVKKLRDNGVTAYITKNTVGMLPAELLLDFSNESVFSVDVDSSPKKLSEIHSKSLINIPGLEESSIQRDILSVYSKEEDVKYGNNSERFSYSIDGDMLYVNGLRPDTKAITVYKATKFFIFAGRSNLIELSKALSIKSNKINNAFLLGTSTALNWNKL